MSITAFVTAHYSQLEDTMLNCWTELVRAPVVHTAHVIHHAAHHVARVHWIAKVVCVASVSAGIGATGFAHGGELPPGPWGQRTAPVSTPAPAGFPSLVFGSSPYVAFGQSVAHYNETRPPHNDHDEDDNLTQGRSPPGSNDRDFDDCDTVTPPPHHEAPEPSSLAVLGAAILSLGLLMRRRPVHG